MEITFVELGAIGAGSRVRTTIWGGPVVVEVVDQANFDLLRAQQRYQGCSQDIADAEWEFTIPQDGNWHVVGVGPGDMQVDLSALSRPLFAGAPFAGIATEASLTRGRGEGPGGYGGIPTQWDPPPPDPTGLLGPLIEAKERPPVNAPGTPPGLPGIIDTVNNPQPVQLRRGQVVEMLPVAGTDSPTKEAFGIGGTDLGEIAPSGEVALLGDSYRRGMPSGDKSEWAKSAGLHVKPGTLNSPSGVEFDRAFGRGPAFGEDGLYADDVLPGSGTQLPAGTIRVNGKDYAMVSNVTFQGTMVPQDSRLVEIDPNAPGWPTVGESRRPANYQNGFQTQISGYQADDGWVYIVADSFARSHEPVLYRVKPETFLDRDSWELWKRPTSDTREWVASRDNAPSFDDRISDDRFGELSMRLIDGKAVLSGYNDSNGNVEVRVAADPTKLFDAPQHLTTVVDKGQRPSPYGGYRAGLNPRRYADLGESVVQPHRHLQRAGVSRQRESVTARPPSE